MADEGEWGPWIEHDGKGCPVRGMVVNGITRRGGEYIWIARTMELASCGLVAATHRDESMCCWSWALPGNRAPDPDHIIRYRIRKPRGMTILERLLEDLPEGVDA